MRYPVKLLADSDGVTLTFLDIPEAITFGATREEALQHAKDALETAIDFYFERNEPVPQPSTPKRGQVVVDLPASVEAKVLLHNELIAQSVRPADLARRLNTTRQEVNRLLDPRHATKIDSIQLAFGALGKKMQLLVSPTQEVKSPPVRSSPVRSALRSPARSVSGKIVKPAPQGRRLSAPRKAG